MPIVVAAMMVTMGVVMRTLSCTRIRHATDYLDGDWFVGTKGANAQINPRACMRSSRAWKIEGGGGGAEG